MALSQLIVCCMLSGCAAATAPESTTRSPSNAAATIITGADFAGNVLQALRTRIPSVRITTPSGSCPLIAFRGALSATQQPNPSIYIDGTLMSDTCILNVVTAQDVDRVEVFTSGDTPYPAITRNASGVILIFRRTK